MMRRQLHPFIASLTTRRICSLFILIAAPFYLLLTLISPITLTTNSLGPGSFGKMAPSSNNLSKIAVSSTALSKLKRLTAQRRTAVPASQMNEGEMAKQDTTFVDRRQKVRDGCKLFYDQDPSELNVWPFDQTRPAYEASKKFIFADVTNKVLYCRVPKAASTSMMKVMLFLSGSYANATSPGDIPDSEVNSDRTAWSNLKPLAIMSDVEIDEILANYTTVMMVRHPLDRLVSAWADKLTGSNENYGNTFNAKIKENYRKVLGEATNAYQRRQDVGATSVTLAEFLNFATKTISATTDVHWNWQYFHCLSCHIDWQYILHFETLKQDFEYLMAKLGWPDSVEFPRHLRKSVFKDSKPNYKFVMQQQSPSLVKEVINSYELDALLFGYSMALE